MASNDVKLKPILGDTRFEWQYKGKAMVKITDVYVSPI